VKRGVDRRIQTVRKGKIVKETNEIALAVTSYWPEEAGPEQLLEVVRDHWSIENGQHYPRDRTQDEDRCTVGDTTAARNLSLFSSLAIFLFKAQSKSKGGKNRCPILSRTFIGFSPPTHTQPA